jgi:COMPASS component SWD1
MIIYFRFRFPSPVLRVQFNPRNSIELLVVPMRHAAVIVSLEGGHKLVPVEDENDLNIYACYDREIIQT